MLSPVIQNPIARVSWRTWLAFLAMCLGMFTAILDIQIVASSLPEIQSGLNIPLERLSWIQTAYLIRRNHRHSANGWLTHTFSSRRLFTAAVLGFSGASLGCAYAGNFNLMIVGRVIQGFCGGCIIPLVFTSAGHAVFHSACMWWLPPSAVFSP